LTVINETVLSVNGRNVKYIEFESSQEGDFVKVCSNEHKLGVEAEYTWIAKKV